MGRKRAPGLLQRATAGGIVWHIDKRIRRYGRLCESTGTGDLAEAEAYLARRIEEIRQAHVFGVRPRRTWRAAATKYLTECAHKRSIGRDAQSLELLDEFIGSMMLDQVNADTLKPFVESRVRAGKAQGTINRDLAVVRRILNLAARSWREAGLTWLGETPLISLPTRYKKRAPYPIDWDEQRLLFGELVGHLERMALFAVNTGCRDQEICQLRWDWEWKVPELNRSVFIVPGELVKNGDDRLVVLNDAAMAVVDAMRGRHRTFVFAFDGGALDRMQSSGWKAARRRAAKRYEEELGRECPEGFRKLRVHDLKHTFGRRLRAVGVSFEDRQDLLGHRSERITTHYSAAEIGNLVKAANLVTKSRESPALTLLKAS